MRFGRKKRKTPLRASIIKRGLPLALVAAAALLMAQLPRGPGALAGEVPADEHLFFGETANITVDGGPLPEGAQLEALDADGRVVATGSISPSHGNWGILVPADGGPIRLRVGAAVSEPLDPSPPGGATEVTALVLRTRLTATRSVALVAGTNGLTYSGLAALDPGIVQDQLADPGALLALFQWDALVQDWLSWRPNVPTFVNSLTSLAANVPLFLILSRSTLWTGPVDAYGAGAWALRPGFVAMPYLGPDGVSPRLAFGQIGDPLSVEAIYRLNARTQTYDVYRRDGPDIANTLGPLNRFDVLFVQVTSPTEWSYALFTP